MKKIGKALVVLLALTGVADAQVQGGGGASTILNTITTTQGSLVYRGATSWLGTGALTGILKGNGTSAPTAVTAPTGAIVGTTDTQTLSGKTLNQPNIVGTTTNDSAAAGSVGETATVYATAASATITVTIASPGVVTWTSHGLICASSVYFTTTGALPTGITGGTTYYVTCGASLLTNSFQLSTTIDNAIAGTSLNTSGTQSGTHTGNSAARLVSGATLDILGLSLTAGQWSCSGLGVLIPAGTTTVTQIAASVHTVANTTAPTQASNGRSIITATLTTGGSQSLSLAPTVYKLASTTTVRLNETASFGTSTMDVIGRLECVRQR